MAIQEKFTDSGKLYEIDIEKKVAHVRFPDGTSESHYIPECVFSKPGSTSLLYAKTLFKVSTLVPRLLMSPFKTSKTFFDLADKSFDDNIDFLHSEDFKKNIIRLCR